MTRLVYFSPVPLKTPAQRPHHFVAWWHRQFGGEVLWIEPYPTRLPAWGDWRRWTFGHQAIAPLGPPWVHEPWLRVLQPNILPLEPLPMGRWLNKKIYEQHRTDVLSWLTADTLISIGKPSELAVQVCQRSESRQVLYDVMDFMHLFSKGTSRRWMQSLHDCALASAGTIWASSTTLQQSVQAKTEKPVHLVRNAASLPVEEATTPFCFNAKTDHSFVLGYIGSIAPWLDWSLLTELAETLTDARIVLIGPVHTKLPTLPNNVIFRPPIPHANVYQAMRHFDVGLIPFLDNELTDGVDPVKYYEYRVADLPVLSTRFGEMRYRNQNDGVWFSDAVRLDNLPTLARTWKTVLPPPDNFALSNNWDKRFTQVASTLPKYFAQVA